MSPGIREDLVERLAEAFADYAAKYDQDLESKKELEDVLVVRADHISEAPQYTMSFERPPALRASIWLPKGVVTTDQEYEGLLQKLNTTVCQPIAKKDSFHVLETRPTFRKVPTTCDPYPYFRPYTVSLRISHKDEDLMRQALEFLKNHIKNLDAA